jgi:hypothetical protein
MPKAKGNFRRIATTINRLREAVMNRAIALLIIGLMPASVVASTESMERSDIIALAKSGVGYSYHWGHGCWLTTGKDHGSCSGSCPSCTHSGTYGADCSGFAAKVWQVPTPSPVSKDEHPYSTYNFRYNTSHWSQLSSRSSLKSGDAMVYNTGSEGHIYIYEKGDAWGSHWAWECKGCVPGCVHDLRTSSGSYKPIRRASVTDTPVVPALDATFVGQGSDLPVDTTKKAYFKACTDQKFHFWFELRNTGSAAWLDETAGKSSGQSVRLGVPGDVADPMVGTARISLNENANNDVKPAGGDCNDKSGCQRTRFTKTGIAASAPSKPGIYKTTWRLVDEGRAWFGPTMYLTFNVEDCPAEPGPDAGTVVTAGEDAGTIVEPGEDTGTVAEPGEDAGALTKADAGAEAAKLPAGVSSGCSSTGSAAPSLVCLLALGLLRRRRS